MPESQSPDYTRIFIHIFSSRTAVLPALSFGLPQLLQTTREQPGGQYGGCLLCQGLEILRLMVPKPSQKDHEIVKKIRGREEISREFVRVQTRQNVTQAARNIIDLLLLQNRRN